MKDIDLKKQEEEETRLITKVYIEYDALMRKVVSPFCRYSNDDFEDMVSETKAYICEKIRKHAYQPTGSFKSWIYSVSNNYLISIYCRNKKDVRNVEEHKMDFLQNCLMPNFSNLSAWEKEQKLITLETILQELPKEDFLLIKLKSYDGLTFKEISEKINAPISTIADRLKRIYKDIRKQMIAKGYIDSSL